MAFGGRGFLLGEKIGGRQMAMILMYMGSILKGNMQ